VFKKFPLFRKNAAVSKIYEALQNVHRRKKGNEASPSSVVVPFAPPEPAGFGLDDEMLSLYKIVETFLIQTDQRLFSSLALRRERELQR